MDKDKQKKWTQATPKGELVRINGQAFRIYDIRPSKNLVLLQPTEDEIDYDDILLSQADEQELLMAMLKMSGVEKFEVPPGGSETFRSWDAHGDEIEGYTEKDGPSTHIRWSELLDKNKLEDSE